MNASTSFSASSISAAELGELASQLIGYGSPLRSCRIGRVLHEDRADGGR